MIRIIKPPSPAALVDGATQKRAEHCAAYDANPDEYLSGDLKFSSSFDRKIYRNNVVKTALCEAQHGKCCYCERHVSISEGHVEHFRPIGRVRQSTEEPEQYPGYYWLAYLWDNLLFSCFDCNVVHKRTLFPLANAGSRARSHHDDMAIEEPLLLNPALEDPRAHIKFREEAPMKLDEIGWTTIDVVGLRRPDLYERRRKNLAYLKSFRRIHELARASANRAELEDEALVHLMEAVQPDAEFSAMAQDYLSDFVFQSPEC